MEQSNKYVKVPLKPFRILLRNETIVRIEDSHAPPNSTSHIVVDNHVVLHCHGQQMSYHISHFHVKECQQCQSPLCGSYGCLELGDTVCIFWG